MAIPSYVSLAAVILGGLIITASATEPLRVTIAGLDRHGRLPDAAAFCPPAGAAGLDVSPGITWSAGPRGTRSYALLMTDRDVPRALDQINKPGIVIPADAPRIKVYHWVLDDIPPAVTALAPGEDSQQLTSHGKAVGQTDHGRRGANVYSAFLATNPALSGTYGGYDGPCPPVNDEQPHRYTVQIFALDIASLGLQGAFDGDALRGAMRGHILAEGAATATYALNPQLRATNR
ncbi:YbhB/YbcL family Raf kinase inhibitor-like protein [Acidisoma sp. 7E03]